jgi:acyl-CoA synthetase (AMP-forming)/AMP-acid ligase II
MKEELTISKILRYCSRYHSSTQIVSYHIPSKIETISSNISHKYSYEDFEKRCCKFANNLLTFFKPNIIISTLCRNSFIHMEICYAITCIGNIFLPINPNLDFECIYYICKHSELTVCFYEKIFQPLVDKLKSRLSSSIDWICIDENYNFILEFYTDHIEWPDIKEDTSAILCYSSGITSKPKGVLYSHRDIVLSSMMGISPDANGLSAIDTVLPTQGFYYTCSWNLIFMAPLVGAKLVLINEFSTQNSFMSLFIDILDQEQVTFSAGIPTFWDCFLEYIISNHYTSRFYNLSLEKLLIGASVINPLSTTRFKQLNINVITMYGLTETLFTGIYSTIKNSNTSNQTYDIFLDSLRPTFGMDIKIDEEDGEWNSYTNGELYIKGLWSIDSYYKNKINSNVLINDWFPTGDIAIMSSDGYLSILERKKDIIKVNGNWTSSLLLENIARNHSNIIRAAALSIADDILGEMCVIVLKTKKPMLETDVLKLYIDRNLFPSYIIFIDNFPTTSNDKIDKESLKQIVYDMLHMTIHKHIN